MFVLDLSSSLKRDDEDLTELILEKKKAIDNYDFEYAETLNNEIEKNKSKQSKIRFEAIKKEMEINMQKYMNDFLIHYQKEDIKNRDFEKGTVLCFQDQISNEENQFRRSVNELETTYNNKMEQCQREAEFQRDHILSKSKRFATIGNFTEAKRLHNEAQELYNNIITEFINKNEPELKSQIEGLESNHHNRVIEIKETQSCEVLQSKTKTKETNEKLIREAKYNLSIIQNRAIVACSAFSVNEQDKNCFIEIIKNKSREFEHKIIEAVQSKINDIKPPPPTDKKTFFYLTSCRPKTTSTKSRTPRRTKL